MEDNDYLNYLLNGLMLKKFPFLTRSTHNEPIIKPTDTDFVQSMINKISNNIKILETIKILFEENEQLEENEQQLALINSEIQEKQNILNQINQEGINILLLESLHFSLPYGTPIIPDNILQQINEKKQQKQDTTIIQNIDVNVVMAEYLNEN